jgi:hypothetical protein
MLKELIPRQHTPHPPLHPLHKSIKRTRILHHALFIGCIIPGINPRLLAARKPEPLTVIVVRGRSLELSQRVGILLGSPRLAQRDGNVSWRDRWDREPDVGFARAQDRVAHPVERKGYVGDDAEESETTGGGAELRWVGDSAVHAVAVDVFDGADVVVDGFVAAAGAVADGAVDSAAGYSGGGLVLNE